MKQYIVGILVLGLSACATLIPGEDAKGKELMAQSTPVLEALIRYRQERGVYPGSLHELVPNYIQSIPFAPNLSLDHKQQWLQLVYSQSFPLAREVACVATLGSTQWTCKGL
ncbi:MAG: hypothetical protein ABIN37_08835 [Burkholderiaceae bacterium]